MTLMEIMKLVVRNKFELVHFRAFFGLFLIILSLLNCSQHIAESINYSKTPLLRPPFGLSKSGLIREVVFISNIIS